MTQRYFENDKLNFAAEIYLRTVAVTTLRPKEYAEWVWKMVDDFLCTGRRVSAERRRADEEASAASTDEFERKADLLAISCTGADTDAVVDFFFGKK